MWQLILGKALLDGIGGSAQSAAAAEAEQLRYANDLRQNQSNNKAIAEANVLNTIRTGYRVGILNVQRGQAKTAAAKNKAQIMQQAGEILGTQQANAAAAGTVGASVKAVAQDIQKRQEEAQLDVQDSFELTQMNFDTELHDLILQGQDSLRSPQVMNYKGIPTQSSSAAFASGFLGSLANTGMMYLGAKASLGLGDSPSTAPTTQQTSGVMSVSEFMRYAS